MKTIPTPLIGLAAGALAYFLVASAIHVRRSRVAAETTTEAAPKTGRVPQDAPSRDTKDAMPLTLADLLARSRQSPREKLLLARSLDRLSTADLQAKLKEGFQALNDTIASGSQQEFEDARSINLLLMSVLAERDPAAAAEWARLNTSPYDVATPMDAAIAWASKDPEGFARRVQGKDDQGKALFGDCFYGVIGALGSQDPLAMARIMAATDARAFTDGSIPPYGGRESFCWEQATAIALSDPAEVRRVAEGLREMPFTAPGEAVPANLRIWNSVFTETAKRYQDIDPAGYTAWVASLPENGRKQAEAAAAKKVRMED